MPRLAIADLREQCKSSRPSPLQLAQTIANAVWTWEALYPEESIQTYVTVAVKNMELDRGDRV